MTEVDQLKDLVSKIRHVADYQLHQSIFVSCFSTAGLCFLKLFITCVIAYTKIDFRKNKDEKETLVRELKTLYSEC
jgi:hypothetical protein